jgi:hypothetical protein
MKPIPGYAGYYLDQQGKVYSDRQKGTGARTEEKHEVTTTDKGHQYARVVLMKDGKKTTKYVHDLLVLTFHGGKRDGQVVRHLDGKTENNTAKNVKPGSLEENVADRVKHDRAKKAMHIKR